MGLQFVFGGSGAGKSTIVRDKVLKQSMEHPEKNYFIMVPDQFTMYTQKEFCLAHPRGGIMNIDVLSFSRLIYRIAEEVGQKERAVLDDTGKNLVLRRVALQKEEQLVLLKDKVKRPGYIHEVKSMISEFYQYDIHGKEMDEMIEQAQGKGALAWKMQDLKVLYDGFADYICKKFITTEESLEELCHMIPRSNLLKNSVVVFDGFTGFTPIQNRVLLELMQVADEVIVTLCADGKEDIEQEKGEQQLFALSGKTYRVLSNMANKHEIPVREPIYLSEKPVKRYEKNPSLAFLEANLFRDKYGKLKEAQSAVSVWEAEHLVCEVQRVCLEICKLVQKEGLCYRDIAIVTGDMSRYTHLLETEFMRYRIPYFIDQNRGVTHQPLTEYLISVLRILKDRFSYESVMRFLRSGMTSLTSDEIDRFDNYIRRFGIRGEKAYQKEFTYSQQAEEMNVIRGKLMDEIAPILVECHSARDYAKAMFELCHANSLYAKCMEFSKQFSEHGDASKAKEYEKIYPACMDLLNQIYELIGEDEMDAEEFLAVFEAGVSEIRIGTIPQNVDQVVVGDIERTRLKKIRVLFFIGVNDGVIPGSGGNGGLLSDMERQFFIMQGRELAPTPRQKIFEQRLYLYQNMTKPTDRLYLSYSMVDGGGKSLLPSYLIKVITGLYEELKIEKVTDHIAGSLDRIATKEDGLDDLAQLLRVFLNQEATGSEEQQALQALKVLCLAYKEDETAEQIREAALSTYENIPLSDMAAELLYKDRNKGSVSRLELFASCAYAHFLRYGLELREQEEFEFDALDFGIVYHHVLESVSLALKQRKVNFADADKELIDALVTEALEEYTKEYGGNILQSNTRNQHRILQMKTVMMNSIFAMQYQLSKGAFKPVYFEKSFRLKGEFPLIGKVDRIDLCREEDKIYVKVIDYKSGNKKFSLEELYYGLSLQLPAYMNAALEMIRTKEPDKQAVPASMLYCRLQNPYVEDTVKDVEGELHKVMRPEGITSDSDKVVGLIHEGLEGTSDVVRIARNKDGSLSKSSQTVTESVFDLVLEYTESKIRQLMEQMSGGEIGVSPVRRTKEKNDSCSYCAYKGVCRIDENIPGYHVKELPELDSNQIEEEMRHEIDTATAGSSLNEK